MSYPTTPQLAGLFMDKPTVDRVMTSKAYTTKTNPLNSFATQAAKSFYGATYADNKPDTPTRQTAAEEPSRAAAAAAAVQKETERIQTEHDRQAQAMQNARTQSEQAQATRTAKQTALSELAPAKTIETHKLDTLGENAISKAMGEKDAGLLGTKADASISKDLLGAAWGLKSPTMAALAARARSNERANDTGNNDGRSDQASKGPENLYSKVSAPEGSLGSPGYYDGNGDYHSGTNPGGAPTGGVKTDQYGREIGAYGQFTRDVVGRGDGSAAAGNTRVICTELVRQGLMDAKLQRLDIAFTLRHLSPVTVRGYHVWAVPYVRVMKRSQLASHLIEPFARWRAEEIAHQMGARERANWKGKCVRWVGEPLCWVLGAVLERIGEKTKGPGFPGP